MLSGVVCLLVGLFETFLRDRQLVSTASEGGAGTRGGGGWSRGGGSKEHA
jgi:hypothetical protein